MIGLLSAHTVPTITQNSYIKLLFAILRLLAENFC